MTSENTAQFRLKQQQILQQVNVQSTLTESVLQEHNERHQKGMNTIAENLWSSRKAALEQERALQSRKLTNKTSVPILEIPDFIEREHEERSNKENCNTSVSLPPISKPASSGGAISDNEGGGRTGGSKKSSSSQNYYNASSLDIFHDSSAIPRAAQRQSKEVPIDAAEAGISTIHEPVANDARRRTEGVTGVQKVNILDTINEHKVDLSDIPIVEKLKKEVEALQTEVEQKNFTIEAIQLNLENVSLLSLSNQAELATTKEALKQEKHKYETARRENYDLKEANIKMQEKLYRLIKAQQLNASTEGAPGSNDNPG